ncbi:MAG: GAF domain-containing protein [Verrucomicrobia bacterium]|nr:GAF domain-containing protein [Verrucomicrobiota bacterium]
MNPEASCRLDAPLGHTPAPLPPDEADRLQALRQLDLLDTPADEKFDRIVKLAARLFNAPIVYVALLDANRQWFKSRIGMEPSETPRQTSFCGHAILQDQPMIIPDARRDLRFAGSPLVTAPPFVRFYAGQPLRGPGGHKVGTLCLLDSKPRTLSTDEIALLHDLGALVEHEFAMIEAMRQQQEAQRLRKTLEHRQREMQLLIEELQTEKERSDDLIRNVLPDGMIEELKTTGTVVPVFHPEVAVMFADFSGFTAHSSKLTAHEVVDELNDCFCHFDWVAAKHGIEKLKTIGDGYLAVSGMPEARPDDALRMLRAAIEIRDYIAERKAAATAEGKSSWDVRIGLHVGPLVAGVVGVRKISYDVWGDTVNTASRVESVGKPGRINVTAAFHERVKAWVESEPRGALECKGKGAVEMYFINALHEPPSSTTSEPPKPVRKPRPDQEMVGFRTSF